MASKTTKIILPLVIVAIAVVILVLLVGSKKPPEQAAKPKTAFLVQVEAAQLQDLNFIVKSQGSVQPKVETKLSAQVSGKVEWVSDNFIEGGFFNKGDVLVRLEKFDYATELKLAEAELARAQAALEEEIARGKVAEQEWRSVKNSIAPELGLRKPQLATEKANVIAAQAQLARAERNLQRTMITAPYDGLVKSKQVDLGQFVPVGAEIGHVYATDVAEVRMPMSDNDLAFMQDTSRGSVAADVTLSANVAGRQTQWMGKLVRDEGILDEQRRVIYAVAEIEDPYMRLSDQQQTTLKFGRFVQTEIIGQRGEGLVILPRQVLRLDGTILTVDKDRTLRIKSVDVLRSDNNNVYIRSGIKAGEWVVTSAVPNPFDGMRVRLPGEKGDISDIDKQDESNTQIDISGDN
ncbi:efflux RND transporter periplasmic adaptor subunit [Aliiglaciecola sp. LCG003]|uniref:efflux RND transporter periplasmic adaptor subunit n=1 Tax=Aliiglaciecola sp. LCG003 TaxID=3053655 RepID=UPI0025724971|nr:efflux RND transporter periplasmic adaptor subunit [Aliiglaciecola sp. LCG003]WJG11061.1 efflux RND transporter periplasmic adaptor subunit [Aliiglaciecola sp. LCG003]